MASGDELAPFVLTNVEGLHDSSQEREKGSGAYGVVYKVSVNGMPCIAKRLHAILTREVSKQEKDSVQAKFRNECIMLSKLQHPNIVHFVGVCYGKSVEELSLIMECLHTDLDQYLETKPNIPLPDKLSILLDVSYGLLYLHTSNPPIIHRDLTAPNILLTKGLRAKIADLGVSKLLSSRSLSAHTQTKGPGQILYMPPEALLENPKYDSKLDVFSFGHLAIFVSSQQFPKVYEVTTRHAVLAMEQGNLQVLKRQKSLDAVGQDHCLYPLIRQCLMDDPERRPSTSELNKYLVQLESKSSEVELSYCQQLKIAKTAIVRLKEHSKEQSKAILELKQHQLSEMTQESLIAENADLQATLCQLEKERDDSLLKLEDEKAKTLTFKLDFEEERSDRERAHSIIGELEKQIMHHKSSHTTHELETLKTALASAEVLKSDYRKKLRDNMASANAEIKQLREELDSRTSQVKQFVKQTAQLKAQLEHATKNIAKLSEEMEKWRKKAKKPPKGDPVDVKSHLYGEIEALNTENESLTQQMEAMRVLNKTLQDMLQQAVRKTSTHAELNTPVVPPEDHQTNEQKTDQQPAKQAAKDDEIRQHLQEQFQQPSPMPHPVDEETPAARPGQWISSQRASVQQFPKSAPNTVQQSTKPKHGYLNLDELSPGASYFTNPKPQQSEQEMEHSYENVNSAVIPGEQVVGSKKPGKLPLEELLNYRTVTRDATQGSGQVPRQTPTDHLSPQDERSNYAATTPQGGSARIATDFETDPARRAAKSNVQTPLEYKQQQQQQQHQARCPMPRALPPESSRPQAMAQPFENQLQRGIDEDISELASDLTGDAGVRQMTNVNAPFDPNLVCPMCMKPFRIGEIQKFKKHVFHCKGSGTVRTFNEH